MAAFTKARFSGSVKDRLSYYSIPVSESGCHLWTGGLNADGYGLVYIDGKTRLAHRVAYETFIGQIPEGFEPDHKCRVRSCINCLHLELVTHLVNCRRGTAGKKLKERTHCNNGHEFTDDNTISRQGSHGRRCRICHYMNITKRRAREKTIESAHSSGLAEA